MRKPITKLNLGFAILMTVLYILVYVNGIRVATNNYQSFQNDHTALAFLITSCLILGAGIILNILYIIFAIIKLDYRYTFHGAIFVQFVYLVSLALTMIIGYFILSEFNWLYTKKYLLPGIIQLLIAISYFTLIYVKDANRAKNVGILLAVIVLLQVLSQLFINIQNNGSWDSITEGILLILCEVSFIFQAIRLTAASEEY